MTKKQVKKEENLEIQPEEAKAEIIEAVEEVQPEKKKETK